MSRWTPEIIADLRLAWVDPHLSLNKICKLFKASDETIKRLAVENDFADRPPVVIGRPVEWEADEVELLRKLWVDKDVNTAEIGAQLKRLESTVRAYAKKIGLPSRANIHRAWPPERVEPVVAMWREGKSAAEIGRAVGVTRNAIIGIIHRAAPDAKRPRVPSPKQTKLPRPKRLAAPRPRPAKPKLTIVGPTIFERGPERPPHVAVVQHRDEPGSATVISLGAHMCKWPIGDPASDDFTLCGKVQARGPYCAAHAARAYEPPQPRKTLTGTKLVRSLRRYV